MRSFACQIIAVGFVAVALISHGARHARADTYVLTNEGQVVGELVNKDESPRQKYIIRTPAGATISLEKSQVKQVVPQSAAEAEYEKIRPTFADTVDDQWRLAEWCRDKNIAHGRQTALERIVELDPENRKARMALGFTQIDGRWVQPDQYREEQGYVRYKGDWRLPQEVELMEQHRKDDLAEKQWYANLKKWRAWYDDAGKTDQVHDELAKIDDPLAVPALTQTLDNDGNRQLRVWCVQALGRIASQNAVAAIVNYSLNDPDQEIRLTCFDQLTGESLHMAVPRYVAALKDKDNAVVNRAGYALGKLGDKSAVAPLIDALVTTHIFKVQEGSSNPNQMSAGFSPNGNGGIGGMTMGAAPVKKIRKDFSNQQVLDALTALTGMNFGFDQRSWKNWYASDRKQVSVGERRD
jgi:hypothetical protein